MPWPTEEQQKEALEAMRMCHKVDLPRCRCSDVPVEETQMARNAIHWLVPDERLEDLLGSFAPVDGKVFCDLEGLMCYSLLRDLQQARMALEWSVHALVDIAQHEWGDDVGCEDVTQRAQLALDNLDRLCVPSVLCDVCGTRNLLPVAPETSTRAKDKRGVCVPLQIECSGCKKALSVRKCFPRREIKEKEDEKAHVADVGQCLFCHRRCVGKPEGWNSTMCCGESILICPECSFSLLETLVVGMPWSLSRQLESTSEEEDNTPLPVCAYCHRVAGTMHPEGWIYKDLRHINGGGIMWACRNCQGGIVPRPDGVDEEEST